MRFLVTVEDRVVTVSTHKIIVRAPDEQTARKAVESNWETVDFDHVELPEKHVISTQATVMKIREDSI